MGTHSRCSLPLFRDVNVTVEVLVEKQMDMCSKARIGPQKKAA